MNGDYKDRTLEQWADETFPTWTNPEDENEKRGLIVDLETHAEMVVKPLDEDAAKSIVRLFLGSLRIWWWVTVLQMHDGLVKENKRLKEENELLRKQNRNLRKTDRKRRSR